MLSIVDTIAQLKKEFPHVEFILEETERKWGSGKAEFYVFKLVKLNNQKFDPPIKTSLFCKKDYYIEEEEFDVARKKMWESFNKTKLLGLN